MKGNVVIHPLVAQNRDGSDCSHFRSASRLAQSLSLAQNTHHEKFFINPEAFHLGKTCKFPSQLRAASRWLTIFTSL